jgi:hypothetical protein
MVRGAELVSCGFDATALKPIVGAHPGFNFFEVRKKSRTADADLPCEGVHRNRLGKVALLVVNNLGGHADVRRRPGSEFAH